MLNFISVLFCTANIIFTFRVRARDYGPVRID